MASVDGTRRGNGGIDSPGKGCKNTHASESTFRRVLGPPWYIHGMPDAPQVPSPRRSSFLRTTRPLEISLLLRPHPSGSQFDLTGPVARDLVVNALLDQGYRDPTKHGDIAHLRAHTRPLGFLLDDVTTLIRIPRKAARFLTQDHRLYIAPIGPYTGGGEQVLIEAHGESGEIAGLAVADALQRAMPAMMKHAMIDVGQWSESKRVLWSAVKMGAFTGNVPNPSEE